MDKQQAALNWVWKYKPPPFAVSITDKEIAAFEAGWEAHEAQQLTMAIIYFQWIFKNGWQTLDGVEFYKEIKAGGRIIKGARDLYAEFNPSGAAPQAEQTVFDKDKINKRLAELSTPPAAGPVWVKGEKRRPEKFGPKVIVRNLKTGQVARFENYGHNTRWGVGLDWDYNDTEWLDESK